jgi:hypothetical protein
MCVALLFVYVDLPVWHTLPVPEVDSIIDPLDSHFSDAPSNKISTSDTTNLLVISDYRNREIEAILV